MEALHRTDSSNPNFIELVRLLDEDLAFRDGNEHAFYAQFNKVDQIRHVVLLYIGETAVACGAIKAFTPDEVEVKRMFVRPDFRGKGFAAMVLKELESWAYELGYSACVLETGKKQPEAIALYTKAGYHIIPNYGQYIGVENSLCFRKSLSR